MEFQALDVFRFIEGHLVTHRVHYQWGIGTVERWAGAQLEVRFYGAWERLETCSPDDLKRHQFSVGDFVRSRSIGEQGFILALRNGPTSIVYQVRFATGQRRVPEGDVVPVTAIDDPFELLRDRQFGDGNAFVLSLQARRLQYAYSYDELVSLSNARIELLPHQVFVAHRVLANSPPRFLLADEVGLGKTIEAGLIIKELRARGAAKRILIVVPSGLVPQWVAELRSKFNEDFLRIDSSTIAALRALVGDEKLWTHHNLIVTSLHLLRGHEEYVDVIAQQHWDLIIFDEAHHLRRTLAAGDDPDRRSTQAYRMGERLQGATDALLLLTATPMQLHPYELYSLIELLDPTIFPTFAHFESYRKSIPNLNAIVERIGQVATLNLGERRELTDDIATAMATANNGMRASRTAMLAQLDAPESTRRLQEEVEELHKLTAVMLRNRKRVVFDDLQPRRAHVLHLEYSEAERRAYDEVTLYIEEVYNQALQAKNRALGFVMVTYRKMLTSSSYALCQSLSRRIAKLILIQKANQLQQRQLAGYELDIDEEEELNELLDRYDAAVIDSSPAGLEFEIEHLHRLRDRLDGIGLDSKAVSLMTALADLLSDQGEKVLIFTQFKETLDYLRGIVSSRYRTATFYGGLDSLAKDAVIDDFRDPDGAQILIATEAAGEGRNLQFCHIMINYDLPWNPMRIEQRIGRLDRIGQTRPVEIYNFAVADTLEDRIMNVLHERIQIFESTIGNLDPILGDIERDIRELLVRRHTIAEEEVQDFEDRVARQMRKAEEMEHRLEDFILGRRSFRQDTVDALLNRSPALTHEDLLSFVTRFVAWSGGRMRERSSGIYEIHPPVGLRDQSGSDLHNMYIATFDPAIARNHDQLEFIAFGHELLDRVVTHSMGNGSSLEAKTATLLIHSNGIAPATYLCAMYEDTFVGIRPVKRLRCVAVGTNGIHQKELSAGFPAMALHAELHTPDAATLGDLETAFDQCMETADALADAQLEAERQERSLTNEQDYRTEHAQQSRYYAAKIESARREVARLEALLAQQRESGEANVQRVIPATQGRLTVAQRSLVEQERALDATLQILDARRSVAASSQLLAAAYVSVAGERDGTGTNVDD